MKRNENIINEFKSYISNNKQNIIKTPSSDLIKTPIQTLDELEANFNHVKQGDVFNVTANVLIRGIQYRSNLEPIYIKKIIEKSINYFYNYSTINSEDISGFIEFINKNNPDLEIINIKSIEFTMVNNNEQGYELEM